jgi:imidazolonepropionase
MTAQWDLLYTNCRAATMAPAAPYGMIDDAAIAVAGGKIVYVGPHGGVPNGRAAISRDLGGACVTPGLIDCHTHLVFGGDRADEFELRLTGTTYQEIQRAGGGIRSTVRKTRAADEDALFAAALWRVQRLMAEGVTTIEIKSGYGLDLDSEARMLRVARRLGRELPVTITTTALCAHTVPPEFAGNADGYIAEIVDRMLPALAREGLVDAVDGFCDSIGFTHAQTARIFDSARALGLPVKLHADQVSAFGGAEVAARYGALSAEHLEYASEAGIAAMAQAGTVAVILPGAYYYLRETTKPPIDLFRKHGVAMAVSTDFNPGSSPLASLLTAMNMACTFFMMTPEETLAGVTRHAAKALGMAQTHGTLEIGKAADLVVWPTANPGELSYWIAAMAPTLVVQNGKEREQR